MTTAQESIRRLIKDDMYLPDEREIAAAILVRAVARATVARSAFHSDQCRAGAYLAHGRGAGGGVPRTSPDGTA